MLRATFIANRGTAQSLRSPVRVGRTPDFLVDRSRITLSSRGNKSLSPEYLSSRIGTGGSPGAGAVKQTCYCTLADVTFFTRTLNYMLRATFSANSVLGGVVGKILQLVYYK